MPTFLFAWNPIKYRWPELAEQSAALKTGEKIIEDWSCASHRKIKIGDRAFLVIVGTEPRGIFASGIVASEPFRGVNRKGNENYRVKIDFDVLLDPAKENILTLEILKIGKMEKQQWTPQASGILIKEELTEELEALWHDFLDTENHF